MKEKVKKIIDRVFGYNTNYEYFVQLTKEINYVLRSLRIPVQCFLPDKNLEISFFRPNELELSRDAETTVILFKLKLVETNLPYLNYYKVGDEEYRTSFDAIKAIIDLARRVK